MRLIIVHYGESIENKNGICQGQMPGKLSNDGIEQAKRLKDEKLDVIFSTDLARALDTAKEIAKFQMQECL